MADIVLTPDQLPPLDDVVAVMDRAAPAASKRAYASDWRLFGAWARSQRGYGTAWDVLPAPVPVVLAWFAAVKRKGGALVSAQRYAVSIAHYHQAAGHPSPTSHPAVGEFFRGWRQDTKGRTPRQAEAVSVELLRYVCPRLPDTLRGTRDRAILLVGFAGGMRESELVGLDVDDVELRDWGMIIRIKAGKTHLEPRRFPVARGRPSMCPVLALEAWLARSRIQEGAIFRHVDNGGKLRGRSSPPTVSRVVKAAATSGGLNPKHYSGHSLRSGFVTACAIAGRPDGVVQATTGHKDRNQLATYQRRVFSKDACAVTFL